MAELATIARPYAEALFKASSNGDRRTALVAQLDALAAVAGNPQLRSSPTTPRSTPRAGARA